MKLDVTTTLKLMDGTPIMEVGKDGQAETAVVRTALVNALLQPTDKDAGIDKMKKYDLAMRIYSAKTLVELTIEECAMVKELVGKSFAPLVVGQLWNLLDGRNDIIAKE
jgi:hypothetical protein